MSTAAASFLGYTRHNKEEPAVDSFPLQAGAAAQLHRLPFNTHTLASLTVSQAFLSFVPVLCFCNNRISLIPNVNSLLGPDSGLRQTLLSLLNSYLAAAHCIGTFLFLPRALLHHISYQPTWDDSNQMDLIFLAFRCVTLCSSLSQH